MILMDIIWEVYETQIIERIKNTEQKETWTEGAERYKEKYGIGMNYSIS